MTSTAKQTKHTPTPWKGPCQPDSNFQKGKVAIKSQDTGKIIANLTVAHASDAAYIVKCVNAHEDLVAALKYCLREHGGYTIKGECEKQARAALAKAGISI